MNIGDKVWTKPYTTRKPREVLQTNGTTVTLTGSTKMVIIGRVGGPWSGAFLCEKLVQTGNGGEYPGGETYELPENALARAPEVGMGATYGIGSDAYPYFITSVSKSGRQFTMRAAITGKNKRQWPDQEYDCTPQTEGDIAHDVKVRLTKKGWARKGAGYVCVGFANYHRDPHF